MFELATIGYEGANADDFIATLKVAGIETLIDIRELPISRRRGFAKTALSSTLAEAGISYFHLKGLGDPKAGREAARNGDFEKFVQIFTAHLATDLAQLDLERAKSLVRSQRSCLMCYERDPRGCHRTIVASAISGSIGATITHLGVREGAARTGKCTRPRKNSGSGQSAAACGR